MKAKKIWNLLKKTAEEFGKDRVLRLSAAMSYYAIFSIGPLLVVVVNIAGLVFGEEAVRKQIEQQLQGLVGSGSAKMVESMMAARHHGAGTIATVVSIIALVFGAAGVFGQLQESLNTIFEVKAKPDQGFWVMIRDRFLSLSMVLGIGFLLLISMALSTMLSAFTGAVGKMLPMSDALAHVLNFIVSFGVITVLFAMIFKFLPDVKVPWRKVWAGAIFTALLFTVGKYLLGLYLGRESTASSYGAAGSVIIVLLWVYYASVILFLGAEFTHVYAGETGEMAPSKYAVPATEEERAEQGLETNQKGAPSRAQPAQPAQAPDRKQPPVGKKPAEVSTSPGAVMRRESAQFFGLMLIAGFLGGFLIQSKSLRRALRFYSALRS